MPEQVTDRSGGGDGVHASVVGALMLSERAPEVWLDLCQRHRELVRGRLLDPASQGMMIRAIGDDLARVAASPRDVIELYADAVDAVTDDLDAQGPVGGVVTAARLVALELMGRLAGAYRAQIWPDGVQR